MLCPAQKVVAFRNIDQRLKLFEQLLLIVIGKGLTFRSKFPRLFMVAAADHDDLAELQQICPPGIVIIGGTFTPSSLVLSNLIVEQVLQLGR